MSIKEEAQRLYNELPIIQEQYIAVIETALRRVFDEGYDLGYQAGDSAGYARGYNNAEEDLER